MDSESSPEMPSLATQTPPQPGSQPAENDVAQVPALEPSTLPTHPLRADDVTCFLPKVIG